MATKLRRRARLTWGDYYYRALSRGDDHGYAAYAADQAMKRHARRRKAKR